MILAYASDVGETLAALANVADCLRSYLAAEPVAVGAVRDAHRDAMRVRAALRAARVARPDNRKW